MTLRFKKKKNKYKAIPIVIDGIRFASQKEGRRYGELKLAQSQGDIKNLQTQPKFPIFINGKKCFSYHADFEYTMDGKVFVEDVKSGPTKTPIYRLKKKCVEAYYGFTISEV